MRLLQEFGLRDTKVKILYRRHQFAMFKARKLLGMVSGAVLLMLAPLWVLFLTQVQVSFLTARLAQVQRQVEESEVVTREFTMAYSQSKLHLDIRQYYSYSMTEVAKLNGLNQDNPEVVSHIKRRLLIPPPANPPKQPQRDHSKGHSEKILNHFKNMTGGFFVECGAMDGTFLSNTLLLEAKYGWTGLLIEADPSNFQQLLTKKRNVWTLPTCLSLKPAPSTVYFTRSGAWAKISASDSGREVHCMPLYSILLAMNRTSIDFFSLDIEGNELDVLRTLPFDKVDIKTFAVEHSNIKEGREHLLEFMLSKGYYEHPSTPEEHKNDRWAQEDYIFIKK